jgi:hypothetical protein
MHEQKVKGLLTYLVYNDYHKKNEYTCPTIPMSIRNVGDILTQLLIVVSYIESSIAYQNHRYHADIVFINDCLSN